MSSSYETVIHTLSVSGKKYQLRSLKNLQQFSDPDGDAEKRGISSATWPIFGIIWPSGLILADIMSHYALDGLRILELGCGLGLASLVAQTRGADITASDHHPLAQSFLNANTKLNNINTISFETCDWAEREAAMGTFDLIIGSDILYERNHPHLLSGFIDQHANHPVTVIIIDPGRHQQGKFTRQMESLGFCAHSQIASDTQRNTMNFKGKILTYTR